jgi:uncharacterized membrane protein
MANGIPLSEWSGSGATRELHESIREFNQQTARQTRQLIVLTWVIAVLTAIMTLGVAVQIVLAFKALK